MFKNFIFVCCVFLCFSVSAQTNLPVAVSIKKTGATFQLYRGGVPYFIKGGGGYDHFKLLSECGGNSIRIWEHDRAKTILDQAQELGLTVMVGLWVGHERHGFDYNDAELVARQLEHFRTIVSDLKGHPALLLWGVGNEVNLTYGNKKVWDAIQGIAKMIHEEDGNHPTVAVISGINRVDINCIKNQCPDIDIVGINAYGNVATVPGKINEYAWEKPYILTEWGPTGHWESPKTSWGAPIEPTSTEKAAICKVRYETVVMKDPEKCLGSYVFMWGNKQEMTATWYSTLIETGEETELVEVMYYEWKGQYPPNRTPKVGKLMMDGKEAKDNISIIRKQGYVANISGTDADKDSLHYEWEIMHEATDLKIGGDQEDTPWKLFKTYKTGSSGNLNFVAPRRKGNYRLFVYLYDGHNHVATANIPFNVKGE